MPSLGVQTAAPRLGSSGSLRVSGVNAGRARFCSTRASTPALDLGSTPGNPGPLNGQKNEARKEVGGH